MGVLYWGESPEQQVNIANSLRLAQVFCEKMASINVCNMVGHLFLQTKGREEQCVFEWECDCSLCSKYHIAETLMKFL